MCFPEIYTGTGRISNKDRPSPVNYSDIIKAEIQNTDRRAAQNMPNLFYKLRKSQIKHVSGKGLVSIRRKAGEKVKTKAKFTDKEMETMKSVHEGQSIFKDFRLSPPYLAKAKRNAFAMVRQKGKPAYFMSFSIADTKWPWFLTTLGVTVNNTIPTLKDVENMSWSEKQDLLNKDPIKTAMLFQHMVLTLISHLKHPCCPLGKMTDFFYRVEGQKRGKLHLHTFLDHILFHD